MRGFLVLVVLLGVHLALISAPIPKSLKQKSLASQVQGTWRAIYADGRVNRNFEFHIVYKADQELEFQYVQNSKVTNRYKGSYTVKDPDETYPLGSITWKIDQNGRERGETSKITTLNSETLIFVDPDGLVEEFERVPEK